jgi:hypothetical protein
MRYWIAICALTISKHVLASPFSEGLAVETQSPDALCPDLATTREAIHNRLGTLALGGEERGWIARYTVGHAPGEAGDFVRLELLDPHGVQRLQRDLPRQDEACATLAQAIALVVERYFRELAPGVAAEPEFAPSAPPVQNLPSVPVPLRTPRWAFGLGVGASTAQPGAIAAAQAGFWPTLPIHLELSLLADLATRHERLGNSELELRTYPVEFGLGFGRRGQLWDFFVGPETRWSLESARGSALAAANAGLGAAWAVGAAGGVSWWPRGPIGVAARASLDYTLAHTKFQIETGAGPKPVLEPPTIQGLFTLSLVFGRAR